MSLDVNEKIVQDLIYATEQNLGETKPDARLQAALDAARNAVGWVVPGHPEPYTDDEAEIIENNRRFQLAADETLVMEAERVIAARKKDEP